MPCTIKTLIDCHESNAKTLAPKIRGRRGRPKTKPAAAPQEKLIDKIAAAVSTNLGQPAVYASTTKGGMKLIYNGHHFAYSFRKGQFSVFQCCYKENKDQCRVRVVCNQKRVFHLDGEHVHFIQATDKSVTSVMLFDTGENVAFPKEDQSIEDPQEQVEPVEQFESIKTISDEDKDPYEIESQPDFDANNFREKIKKRLQKALLGKKK